MPFRPLKLSGLVVVVALIALPLIMWLILYLARHRWSDLRPALLWIKTLRWIGWIFGVTLLLMSLAGTHLPWAYGIAVIASSAGLSIPESWIKARSL